ncbi:MAG: nuclear transport factor 2 family protein [Novosphingobium sp.]|nr:nuclear transport factor 2 family protein [Novosphingobium sp.]
MSRAECAERFLHAYFHGDAQTVMDCVTDDFTWVNIALPKATVTGRAALAAKLAVPNLGLPLPLEGADHDTTLAMEQGDRLMHERVDRLRFAGETLEIPCAAAWEFRDGRIAAWRDYYDIGVVVRFFGRIGHPLDTSAWW